MKRKKLYEFAISRPLTPDRRQEVIDYIHKHVNLDEKATCAWREDAPDVLQIASKSGSVEAAFEGSRISIYLSAPAWAAALLTKRKKEEVKLRLVTALQDLGFVHTNENEADPAQQAAPADPAPQEAPIDPAPQDILMAQRPSQLQEARLGRTREEDGRMSANAEAVAHESSPFSALGDALESAADSIGDATSDARTSAKNAARNVKRGLSTGTYHAAYGVSYGIVFSAVFLTELLSEDNVLRRGFADGAYGAIDAVAQRKARSLADETSEHGSTLGEHERVHAAHEPVPAH